MRQLLPALTLLLSLGAAACSGESGPRRDKPLDGLSEDDGSALCKQLDALTVGDPEYARISCSLFGQLSAGAARSCEQTRDACLQELESSCRPDDGEGMTLDCPNATVGDLLECVRAVSADFKQRYAQAACSGPAPALPDAGAFGWPSAGTLQPECRALARDCPALFALPNDTEHTALDGGSDGGRPDADASEVNADPILCGGAYRDPCAANKYCAWGDGCGTAGNCRVRSRVCTTSSPVCGCDGQSYESECAAAEKGVGLAHAGACAAATTQFRCGDFVCDGASYCLDLRKNRRDPDQQGFACVPLPSGCTSCACLDQLGKACFIGATCESSGNTLNVVCK